MDSEISTMNSPSWLPPLNLHDNFDMNVRARQLRSKPNNNGVTTPQTLSISLNVLVSFQAENITDSRIFLGLDLRAGFKTSSIQTPALLAGRISRFLIDSGYVPFQLERVYYMDTQITPEIKQSSAASLTGDDVIARLADFAQQLISVTRSDHNVRIKLTIEKIIRLPKNEIRAWVSWYDEQALHSDSFEEEYERAITRPRTEDELMVEANMASFKPASKASIELGLKCVEIHELESKSCAVCLEDLVINRGVHELRKMPCLHVFHKECIDQWLNTSCMCPLCRYELSTTTQEN